MSDRQEENELLDALVTGDPSAWRNFVERYQGCVYARIVRTAAECNRVLPAQDLEDICAEVFSSLIANNYASLRRFEGRSKLSTWLSVVSRRTCLRKISQNRIVDGAEICPEQTDTTRRLGALDSMIAEEDAQRVRECMAELSEADREVLKLFFDDELSYQEIGARLNISTNAVGPKLHRAQQRLKKLLGDERTAQQRSSQP